LDESKGYPFDTLKDHPEQVRAVGRVEIRKVDISRVIRFARSVTLRV